MDEGGLRAVEQEPDVEAIFSMIYSAAEVWSCTIFHPAGSRLKINVNNP